VYFTLKALARSVVLPPAGPLILALLGALLIHYRRRFGWTLLVSGLGSLWLCATPLFADSISRLAERYPALDLGKPTNAQAIVILGGGGHRNWAPEFAGPVADNLLLERLSYGAYLSRRTSLPILISGAPDESVAMRTTLARDLGVPARWVEDQSLDTYQNARLSVRLLRANGVKRIILVTSSTHIWRAAHEFQQVGLDVVPAPSGVLAPRELGVFRFVPSPSALLRSHLAIYELIGEPARELQSALGVREKLDKRAQSP
jgi:uncharacterized SAM-binding protein YcdF (DUF218 family)